MPFDQGLTNSKSFPSDCCYENHEKTSVNAESTGFAPDPDCYTHPLAFMLHLIFQAPLDLAVLDRMAEGDVAVFMESAVFHVLKQGQFDEDLTAKLKTNRLCVIEDDIQARGILPEELIADYEVIDYDALVNLSVENKQIITWR